MKNEAVKHIALATFAVSVLGNSNLLFASQQSTSATTTKSNGTKAPNSMAVSIPKENIQAPSVNFEGSLSLDYSTDLKQPSNNEKQSSSTLELSGAYKIQEGTSATGLFALTKNYTAERETVLQNGFVGISQRLYAFDNGNAFSAEYRQYAPLNKENRETDSLMTKSYIAPKFSFNGASVGIEGLKATIKIAASKNFHQYKNSSEGKSNTSYSFSNTISVDYDFNKSFSINAYVLNGTGYNYNGRRLPSTYEMGQSISYSYSEDIQFSLGHQIGGNAYKANGLDSNYKFFNQKDSAFSFSIALAL